MKEPRHYFGMIEAPALAAGFFLRCSSQRRSLRTLESCWEHIAPWNAQSPLYVDAMFTETEVLIEKLWSIRDAPPV